MNENHMFSKFGGITPIYFTKSFATFAEELSQSYFLLLYILALDEYLNVDDKTKALDDIIKAIRDPDNPLSVKFTEVLKNDLELTLFDALYYERLFGQMTLCRYVDNFLCYLKDVLVEVVNKNPNVLKSSETEKLEDILSFETIRDLREFIIEKKLKALFYKNIEDIQKFFTDKLGIDILGEKRFELILLIKQRNIIVHNRARINVEFAEMYPQYGERIGDQLIYSYVLLEQVLLFLNNLAAEIDTKLIEKFRLQKVKNPLLD